MSYENTKPVTATEIYIRNWKVLMSQVHTTMPGVIETYDGNRICSVKPGVSRKLADGTFLVLPILNDVPVLFPGGADFGMTWPLEKGTPVLIHICERSIEDWLQNGKEAKPEDLRRFSLTDAVVVPGLYHKGNPFPEANNDDFQIIYKDANINIKKDGTILLDNSKTTLNLTASGDTELNGNSKTLVTYKELDTAIQAMKASIEASILGAVNAGIVAHTHVSNGPGVPTVTGVGTIAAVAPPVTVDISASQTITIKTGG